MNNLVRLDKQNDVAVVTIDNPPVNAIGAGVPEGIAAALDVAEKDSQIRAVVIIGAGRTFVAGADIRELEDLAAGRGPGAPNVHALFGRIEDFPKPIIMAIHGTALGGGLELAMAGHYRVASTDAKLGQPEVNLGIIPGAEGTQRLPRIVGIAAAIDMCVSGKPISAKAALELGLVDEIVETVFTSTGTIQEDLRDGAVEFARKVSVGPHSKTRDHNSKLGDAATNAPLYAAGREQARRIRRNQTAPLAVIDAIEAAATLPFDEGCRREHEIFFKCIATSQARALIHAFFAERAVSKIPGISKETPVIAVRSAAIIGAGTMGGGIAMALANAGISVLLKDADNAALDRGIAAIRKNYLTSVQKGRFTPKFVEERMAMIHPQTGYEGFESVDIIIEAVFESMALKKQIFGEIDKIAKPNCILATNTSTLDIDEIAAATSRPKMVIGTHFFSPANIMRLVEIVRGGATADTIIASALALAKNLGKVGVVVGNCWGFVGNRMMFPYMREAQFLVEEGATPSQVDKVLYDFGMAMGIFAVDDMGGIDIAWRVRQERKHLEKPGIRVPLVADRLYELGRLGQKTGKGWYLYGDDRKPVADPEVQSLIETTAKAAGISRRAISDSEILERCLYAMINEGARILDEGFAARAADIDVIYISGYGFPAYHGGPMWYADTVGLTKIYERILEFQKQHGELWEPAPLLKRLAVVGGTFADYDVARK
jgi:3-hydroxyacyl-CoA dehydrogenase